MVNVVGTLNVLTAARDQAIEMGRKGGLARAARLSPRAVLKSRSWELRRDGGADHRR